MVEGVNLAFMKENRCGWGLPIVLARPAACFILVRRRTRIPEFLYDGACIFPAFSFLFPFP
jgi:hypothetical protein